MNILINKYKDVLPKRLPAADKARFDDIIEVFENEHNIVIHSVRHFIYVIVNDVVNTPVMCPVCGNPTNWLPVKKRYAIYCSVQCANTDKNVWSVIDDNQKHEIIEKRKQTNVIRYGSSNYLSSDSGRQKTLSTLKERYGVVNVSQIPEVQTKKIETSIERYGVDHPSKSQSIKNKIKETNNVRWGRDSWSQKHLSDDVISKLNDKEWMYDQHITKKRTIARMSVDLENVDGTTIGRYLKQHNIPVLINGNGGRSSQEDKILGFLDQHNIKYVANDRTIIYPKEIDIYIPEHNLAIEVCGIYWHGDWRLDKTYHLDKLKACATKGIKLINLWDVEVDNKWDIIKSLILHNCGITNNRRIYARKCSVDTANNQRKKEFLNRYHIQGNGPGSLTLGLFNKQEMVAVATFVKKKGELVLNRYATKYHVIGGLGKILKNIQLIYSMPIVTFADRRVSNGKLYERLNFTKIAVQPPNYHYVVNKKIINRAQFRRKYLQERLKTFDPSKTEFQNCDANGIVRLWDCGLIKYKLNCYQN